MVIKINNIRLSLSDKHVLTENCLTSDALHLSYSHYHFIGIQCYTLSLKLTGQDILASMPTLKKYKGTEDDQTFEEMYL